SVCAPAAILAKRIVRRKCLRSISTCLKRKSIVCRVAKVTAMSRELLPGQIIAYPYLWAWQNDRGETDGRKSRPTCVVVAVRSAKDGLTHLALLAVTTQPPQLDRAAIEVPDTEARRAG